jgi:hypothetical protein
MGILKSIGFLDDEGNLSNAAKDEFINDVITESSNLPPAITIAGVTIPIDELNDMLSDETAISAFDPASIGGIDAHKEQFPQYHSLYVDTLYSGLAKTLDLEPSAKLKNAVPVPIFDPTEPILLIMLEIQDILETIEGFVDLIGDVTAFIVSQIDLIMSKIVEIASWVLQILPPFNNFNLDFIKDLIVEMIEAYLGDAIDEAQEFIEAVKAKIEEKAAEIEEKVVQPIIDKFNSLAEFVQSLPPDIPFLPFNLDLFNFNFNLDINFLLDLNLGLPWFDLSIFQLDFPPGIVKLIVDFVTGLAAKIAEIIAGIFEEAAQFIAAMLAGMQALLEFMIDLVLGPIIELLKSVWPDISQYTIPAASFLAMFKKVIPMVIVGVVGILIGPGLVTFGLGQLLGLI